MDSSAALPGNSPPASSHPGLVRTLSATATGHLAAVWRKARRRLPTGKTCQRNRHRRRFRFGACPHQRPSRHAADYRRTKRRCHSPPTRATQGLGDFAVVDRSNETIPVPRQRLDEPRIVRRIPETGSAALTGSSPPASGPRRDYRTRYTKSSWNRGRH